MLSSEYTLFLVVACTSLINPVCVSFYKKNLWGGKPRIKRTNETEFGLPGFKNTIEDIFGHIAVFTQEGEIMHRQHGGGI